MTLKLIPLMAAAGAITRVTQTVSILLSLFRPSKIRVRFQASTPAATYGKASWEMQVGAVASVMSLFGTHTTTTG